MITVDSFIEVTLKQNDDFLKVKETLTRIGIASEKNKTLYQSCHILHKKGKYYIVHFKELFALDGRPSSLTDDDVARRNTIVNLLSDWGLVGLVDVERTKEPVAPMRLIKVIPYKQKNEWQLVTKYNIGRSKKEGNASEESN
jgi:Bacteriophage translational regulator